jgi:hypothetical protein
MGTVVKPGSLGPEIVNGVCANRRVVSDQAHAPWRATRVAIGGAKVNGSLEHQMWRDYDERQICQKDDR